VGVLAQPTGTCVQLRSKCPGKGWVTSACDEKDPCGTGVTGYSTSDSDIARTLGTALGKLAACKLFGLDCPGSVEDSSARANYRNLTIEQRMQLIEAIEEQEQFGRVTEKRVAEKLEGRGEGLQLRDFDEPVIAHPAELCGSPSLDVSRSLQDFNNEARQQGFTFLAEDVKGQILTEEALKSMRLEDHKALYDRTRKQWQRYQSFSEELKRIEACLTKPGCDLIELNRKINNELSEWLQGQLSAGLQSAISRVKSAQKSLQDFVWRISKSNEKALAAATSCAQR
jgi:hypothetical protein